MQKHTENHAASGKDTKTQQIKRLTEGERCQVTLANALIYQAQVLAITETTLTVLLNNLQRDRLIFSRTTGEQLERDKQAPPAALTFPPHGARRENGYYPRQESITEFVTMDTNEPVRIMTYEPPRVRKQFYCQSCGWVDQPSGVLGILMVNFGECPKCGEIGPNKTL